MSVIVTSTTDVAATPAPQAETQAQTAEAAPKLDDASSAKAQGEESEVESAGESEARDDAETQSDEPKAQEVPKKKSGIQRLKERHAREMAEIRQELESLKTQAPRGQRNEALEAETVVENPEPKEEDFETHADYVRALAKHTYAEEKARDEQKSREAQAVNEYKAKVQAHQARVAEFSKATPDYAKVISEFIEDHGDMRFSVGLEESILESELGPAVIFELAKNPEELNRINRLSLVGASREIGKIEERILARKAQKPEPKLTTKAPPPPTPLVGKPERAGKKSILDPDISFAEYERLRAEGVTA